jgi:hypothetical protein
MNQFIRGMIIPLEGSGKTVRFQYNPRHISGPQLSPQYATLAVAGRELPFVQYGHGRESQIHFELQYSGQTDGGSFVKEQYEALKSLTEPTVRGASMNHPPKVMLIFGTFFRERCVVVEVNPDFTMPFHVQTLVSLNATIGITLWRLGT